MGRARPKFPCRHPGCPASFVAPEYRDEHEARKHTRCTCGRHFTEVAKHLAACRRRGLSHPKTEG